MKAGQAMVQLKSCVNQLNPVGQTLAASPVTPLDNTGHANGKTNKVYTQSCKEKKKSMSHIVWSIRVGNLV